MGCGMEVESPVMAGAWVCAGLVTYSPDWCLVLRVVDSPNLYFRNVQFLMCKLKCSMLNVQFSMFK